MKTYRTRSTRWSGWCLALLALVSWAAVTASDGISGGLVCAPVFLFILTPAWRPIRARVEVRPDGLLVRNCVRAFPPAKRWGLYERRGRYTALLPWTSIARLSEIEAGKAFGRLSQPAGIVVMTNGVAIKLESILAWSGSRRDDNAAKRSIAALQQDLRDHRPDCAPDVGVAIVYP